MKILKKYIDDKFVFQVISKKDKFLGSHKTELSAKKQVNSIKANKRKKK